MNIINVSIDFEKGICKKEGISLVTGDYNTTKVVFEFNEGATGRKVFKMKNPSDELVYADDIVNNEVVLVGYEEENGETTTYSLFGEEGDYIFEVALYQDNGRITSVYDYITANKEQVVVEGEVVEEKITLFDNLMNELNAAITETNNLDLDAEKEKHTTTITITRKDGTSYDVEVLDGEKGEKGDKGDAGAIKMQIVQVLPETGSDDTIYLVPLEEPDTEGNNYAEYIYVNGQWELLGKIGVQIDLSNYVQFTDYATGNKGGVIKVSSSVGTSMNSNGYLQAVIDTYTNYQSKTNSYIISKGTLENVITGKGLVSNTSYASTGTGGVIKTAPSDYATSVSNGYLLSQTKTYAQYTSANDNMFVSKGTLENVLTEKIGTIETILTTLDVGGGTNG